jgi:hypothetical protein
MTANKSKAINPKSSEEEPAYRKEKIKTRYEKKLSLFINIWLVPIRKKPTPPKYIADTLIQKKVDVSK